MFLLTTSPSPSSENSFELICVNYSIDLSLECMLTSIRNVKLYKMRKFIMFITAVCILFLIKLRWPKNKSIFELIYQLFCEISLKGSAPMVGREGIKERTTEQCFQP